MSHIMASPDFNQPINTVQNTSLPGYRRIAHIALAVRDLETSIGIFRDVLGFELKRRREKNGALSADMEYNGIYFVLSQGIGQDTASSRQVERFGVGLDHIAVEVDDVDKAVETLVHRGLEFDTNIIREPGVTHAFSTRNEHTGVCFEIINFDSCN